MVGIWIHGLDSLVIILGYILGYYGDNGKENGNYYSISGLMSSGSAPAVWALMLPVAGALEDLYLNPKSR